jgi:hypothetical protein
LLVQAIEAPSKESKIRNSKLSATALLYGRRLCSYNKASMDEYESAVNL